MIVLKANVELKSTFDKLIRTMGVSVIWSGDFAVIDNCLILVGQVRSLFFHFDSRKVVENIIELPIREDEIIDTSVEESVRNAINMILYAFGKWGTVKGLKVDKDYAMLNQLFGKVVKELLVEPEYTKDYFRFYKDGIRITYEDVIQAALEVKEREEEKAEDAKVQGLWHKVVWKTAQASFRKVQTTLLERQKGRLGNNFYMIGYLCPSCLEKLHMVVYPQGREFRIETGEGAVLLARACTCDKCSSYYTPQPEKMLGEGDIYILEFEDDRKAYEDYLELLGKKGDRVSNYRFNEFEEAYMRKAADKEETPENLEHLCEELSGYTDEAFQRLANQIEEGFFPDESVVRCEERIREQVKKRRAAKGKYADEPKTAGRNRTEPEQEMSAQVSGSGSSGNGKTPEEGLQRGQRTADGAKPEKGARKSRNTKTAHEGHESEKAAVKNLHGNRGGNRTSHAGEYASAAEQEAAGKKYEAKMQVIDRLSERQLRELKSQLEHEPKLLPELKESFLEQVEHILNREKAAHAAQKVRSCEGKNYAVLKKVYDDIEKEDLPEQLKEPFLEQLKAWRKRQGETEVRQLMEKLPPHLDRGGYKRFMERLRGYEGVDLTPFEAQLKSAAERAEQQEIAGMVRRARKNSRKDLSDLVNHLLEQDFSCEMTAPYLEKLEGKIRQMDEEALADLTGDAQHMSFAEGVQAYEAVEQGEFLPELKSNALKMLEKRLTKIKTDECELLVKKLTQEMEGAGVKENERHHFYPARKVLLRQALPEDTEVIDYAMASYAAGCGQFEYPVLVVDTSRNQSGKEGIILTPDQLYYSTMLSAYGIRVSDIAHIKASTGLLNKGLYVHQKNGTKTKVPYAVEGKELSVFAEVMDNFIHYLQEKPESREVTYLAKEKHETICCFRCGYVYKDGNVCPKCGYKSNG